MALAKNEKERIVEEVKAVVADASTLVISDARGLKVSELSEIRKEANEKANNEGPLRASSVQPKSVSLNASFARVLAAVRDNKQASA